MTPRVLLALPLLVAAAACHDARTPAVPVARSPLDMPAPTSRATPETVTVDLVVREVLADIGDGKTAWVWTFDGTVPGPLVRVIEGDTVVLRLTNEAANVEPHSIDLHAVMGPGGGHAVTEVDPGETAELRFVAARQGAYFYHCGAEGKPWEHVAYGMYGVILVEPPGGLPPVDLELYVTQAEWYLRRAGSGGGEHEEEEEEEAHGGGAPAIPDDVWVLDEDAAAREQPTLFTFNGHTQALVDPALFGRAARVGAGGRVRIVFANAGPNLTSSVHVVGAIFDAVYTGHFEDVVRNEETLLVAPGSAAVLELTLPAPGEYPLVDHALFRAARGALGLLHADAE
jgi:nitrite reductase (NO-forming)